MISALMLVGFAVLGTQASAVSGAAFTTFNAAADGAGKDVCKNSVINCNIYGAKEYVWLNGGPAANGLGPDGEYFFAVLEPGGQPDPNDGGAKNLSDYYDEYTNRTFTVTNGEVSAYFGTHDYDPPLIRLFPYLDTTNPGESTSWRSALSARVTPWIPGTASTTRSRSSEARSSTRSC